MSKSELTCYSPWDAMDPQEISDFLENEGDKPSQEINIVRTYAEQYEALAEYLRPAYIPEFSETFGPSMVRGLMERINYDTDYLTAMSQSGHAILVWDLAGYPAEGLPETDPQKNSGILPGK